MDDGMILSVQGLKKHFPVTRGMFFPKAVGSVKAVDNITFHIRQGETLGLVGESGCGKSTTANTVLALETPTSGRVLFQGRDISRFNRRELFHFRRNIQAVFQDPFRSLNPRKKVRKIIGEPLWVHKVGTKKEIENRIAEFATLVGFTPRQTGQYPHEFSGGQRQRIAIARALALNPKMIVLDEPVSALDVSIQAQILNLLMDLRTQFGLTYLIISHDLAVVEHISTHIGVMYLGNLVELAHGEDLYGSPRHPYTRALLSSVPVADPEVIREVTLEGEVPSPMNPPAGCPFNPRCPEILSKCREEIPVRKEVSPGHWVSCHCSF
jgi:oligopeptide/dipeptide ABC transporter ATP-binding protein